MKSSKSIISISFAVLTLALFIHYLLNQFTTSFSSSSSSSSSTTTSSILQQLARDQFAWEKSTTSIPISSVSVYAKLLLSRDDRNLPTGLRDMVPQSDSISLQSVRDYFNIKRLEKLTNYCKHTNCDVSTPDPIFGLTPLHLAASANDAQLMSFLTDQGALPKPDHVGRMPANLSFTNFMTNSKQWAKPGSECQFPVVDFEKDLEHAKSEVKRLVAEGEPVLMKGAYRVYMNEQWDVESWVQKFSHHSVTVGKVPYADAFSLKTERMKLADYYQQHVVKGEEQPSYVFNKNAEICKDGYDTIVKLMMDAFPMGNLIVHPDETGKLQGIHFFFGKKGSGAPFHVHADAVNAAISGRKRWFVFTPGKTIYSRKTIKRWVEEDLNQLGEDEKPMECMQYPGDVVYVPLDWGHAVLNEDDNTFGYALEILNKRDTLATIWR